MKREKTTWLIPQGAEQIRQGGWMQMTARYGTARRCLRGISAISILRPLSSRPTNSRPPFSISSIFSGFTSYLADGWMHQRINVQRGKSLRLETPAAGMKCMHASGNRVFIGSGVRFPSAVMQNRTITSPHLLWVVGCERSVDPVCKQHPPN